MFDTYADGGSGVGITYSAALGSSTLSIGVMQSADNNSSGTDYVSDTPDIEASFSTTAGMATLTVAGALHTAMDRSMRTLRPMSHQDLQGLRNPE